MPSQEIKEKYDAVQSSLENAIKASDNIEISGEEENAELNNIRKALNQLNYEFKDEIKRLENSSEWDKFCMAFFGETNAGKSTIIEALRIVYDEESRREEIDRQKNRMKEELSKEKDNYSELINSLKQLNDSLAANESSNSKEAIKIACFIVLGLVIGLIIGVFIL